MKLKISVVNRDKVVLMELHMMMLYQNKLYPSEVCIVYFFTMDSTTATHPYRRAVTES